MDQKEKFTPRGVSVEYVGADGDSSHEQIRQGLCQLVYMHESRITGLQPSLERVALSNKRSFNYNTTSHAYHIPMFQVV